MGAWEEPFWGVNILELYVCLSNLKKVHRRICRELNIDPRYDTGLAIWEQLKNIEHRIKGTRAYVSLTMNDRGPVVKTRNQVSVEEIQSCIDGKCLSNKAKMDLTHLRGEDMIIAFIGQENYDRYIDPWTREMVSVLHVPTNKN